RQAGFLGNERARLEAHGLLIAVRAGGLEAGLFELRRDVVDRLAILIAADVAPLHFVRCERLDVAPPELSFGSVVDGGIGGKEGEGRRKEECWFAHKGFYLVYSGALAAFR